MRVVFMGTPSFALPSLDALIAAHEVVTVYTQPDRPSGRGRTPVPSPVKRLATAHGIPVHQPVTLREPAEVEYLKRLVPDVVCVAAYGLILPPEILAVPRFGCINVHASLLPRYRGAAPVHRAILAGDERTGVSIMRMEEGLDTGPYARQDAMGLDDLTVDEATEHLAELGAGALLSVLDAVATGAVEWVAQDESAATYAEKVSKEDVALRPGLTVAEALRRIRASSRSASSRACVDGRNITLVRGSSVIPGPPPGTAAVTRDALVLGFADGGVSVDEIRPEGKTCMDGACFARGARLADMVTWEPCS
ncbi:MAG: methionyl-tRNA formyltransferase [Anaerosomatales bacterium]|nr:methionyl-tRNA formyltransferase [Anaerosomatales bacterium]MDT8433437.1 methionyl-tRNA formyltransferase [Anaerosomatales bacterium]